MGATTGTSVTYTPPTVSILAHLERWALRSRRTKEDYYQKVSILAHLERWALRDGHIHHQHGAGVSILAHLERWALLGGHGNYAICIRFQSSPTSKGGRYVHCVAGQNSRLVFQSSPTSKGGRYVDRCMDRRQRGCFNPRPPRKVGATRGALAQHGSVEVSILAHLERWALRRLLGRQVFGKEFQSSPTSKGGRYVTVTVPFSLGRWVSILAHLERWALRPHLKLVVVLGMFQSSPTSKGGRYSTTKNMIFFNEFHVFSREPVLPIGEDI